eukprot:259455_1
MAQFTALAKNIFFTISLVLLYYICNGFSYPILSCSIFAVISIWLVFLLTTSKKHDMDMLTAFLINGRGVKVPTGQSPLSLTQNCCIYFENKLDFNSIKSSISKTFFKFKRLSHIPILQHHNSALWDTKWIKIKITNDITNKMINKHTVSNNNQLYNLIDKLCNQTLSNKLPKWIFHYIENNNGLSVFLFRCHHGIADGIRLIHLASEIFTDANGNKIDIPKTSVLQCNNFISKPNLLKLLLTPRTYFDLLSDLYQIWYTVYGPMDRINPFKPDNNIHSGYQIHIRNKSLIKISDIKILKQKYNVSFNDVLTCLTCSGIRSYILC